MGKWESSWCFWVSYRLLFTCPLWWGMYDILASSIEWEGGRQLEGGISELSILPTAQQVKVTLHFMYFPPISICEQNKKKKNRGRHRTQENKKWWKMREKTIISHFCSQIYNTSYCFKQNDVSFGWSYIISVLLLPLKFSNIQKKKLILPLYIHWNRRNRFSRRKYLGNEI